MSEDARLLGGHNAPEPRHAAVFLVGSYDGSGNYGDMLQLQATLELLARLGPAITPITVIELEYRATHEELIAGSPQLAAAPVCYFDAAGGEPPAGLRRLQLPADLPFTALYLYGGGYLNPTWGTRKLAMARAVDEAVRAAGLPAAWCVSSGLQVDVAWAAGLEGSELELLRRLELFGVRDERSVPPFVADGRALLTGDDAVGVLARAGEVATPSAPDGDLRVNVHLLDETWVTDDPAAHVAFVTRLLGALEAVSGPLRVQPVIAYDDRRISERALVERLAGEPALAGRIAGEPVTLRPGGLERSLEVLGEAALTVSCSYHVGLTSSLLGVPTALLAGNPYYAQKAAGLRSQFTLPEAFTIDPHGSPDAAAGRLAEILLDADARDRLAAGLRLGALRSVARRHEAELEILGRLSAALLSALAARGGGTAGGRVSELMERLAMLRVDHGELLTSFDRVRARLAEREALIEERAHEYAALWEELNRYVDDKRALLARTGDLEKALDEQSAEAERLRQAEARMRESLSWRMTSPLRRAARLVRRD